MGKFVHVFNSAPDAKAGQIIYFLSLLYNFNNSFSFVILELSGYLQ